MRLTVRRAVLVAGLLLSTAATVIAPSAQALPTDDGPLVTINASGGTGPTDGLKLEYASGNMQIFRRGGAQLYSTDSSPVSQTRSAVKNFITLAVGNTIVGAPDGVNASAVAEFSAYTYVAWDTISSSGGSATGSGQIQSVLTSPSIDGRVYAVNLTIDYTAPNDFYTMTYDVVVPDGSTDPVRLYWYTDSQLGGSDSGNQFGVTSSPAFIGVVEDPAHAADSNDLQVEGVRERPGGGTFNFVTGRYSCPKTKTPRSSCPFGYGFALKNADLPNTVDPAVYIDNGFLYQFGPVTGSGTHRFAADMVFTSSNQPPVLSLSLSPVSAARDEDITLTYTLTGFPNAAALAGLGFEHSLVSGIGHATFVSSTCGGTARVNAEGTGVSLTGGALDAGTTTTVPSCQVVVTVRASHGGTFDFGSGVSVTGGVNGIGAVPIVVTGDPTPPETPPATPPAAGEPAGYLPLAPARLLDTRDGERVAAESVTEVLVAGRGGVPEDATAVVVNVAVDDPAVAGFVTVYPCGTERPLASNVNFVAGQTTSNNVTVKVGAGGKMCIYTTAPIHLVVDVNGAHVPHGGEGRFDSLNPWRLLDTRDTGIKLGAGDTYQLTVAGRDGIAADATAAVLNVTVTTPDAAGFVTVYPCGTELPLASNLNFATSEEVANAVIAKIGTNGAVCIYTTAPIHLVVDANGAFTPAGIETFGELEPFRLLDTRDTTRVAPGSDTELVVAGHDGIPANATSVVLNVTVVDPLGDGFVTAYPCGTERPLASNVNYTTGKTVPNAVTVAIGDNGNVCLYSKQATHLVVDTSGAFTPTTA